MFKILTYILNFIKLSFQSFFNIIKVLILSPYSNKINKHKPLIDEAIILGNGPGLTSTLKENENALKNKKLICVNYFADSDLYGIIQPEYYVIIDPILFSDSYDDEAESKKNVLFNNITNKTTWSMFLIIANSAKKHKVWNQILGKNKNIKILYLNLIPFEGFSFIKHRLFNKNLGMPRPHNVLIPAIYFCLKINVKKIYLIGAEHTWLKSLRVDQNNQVVYDDEHFYDTKKESRRFCYNTAEGRTPVKYHEALYTFMRAFMSYYTLKDYANYKKAEIINCTLDSFIDAFRKEEFSKIK